MRCISNYYIVKAEYFHFNIQIAVLLLWSSSVCFMFIENIKKERKKKKKEKNFCQAVAIQNEIAFCYFVLLWFNHSNSWSMYVNCICLDLLSSLKHISIWMIRLYSDRHTNLLSQIGIEILCCVNIIFIFENSKHQIGVGIKMDLNNGNGTCVKEMSIRSAADNYMWN